MWVVVKTSPMRWQECGPCTKNRFCYEVEVVQERGYLKQKEKIEGHWRTDYVIMCSRY